MHHSVFLRTQGRRVVGQKQELVSPSYDWRKRKEWENYLARRPKVAEEQRERRAAWAQNPKNPALTARRRAELEMAGID